MFESFVEIAGTDSSRRRRHDPRLRSRVKSGAAKFHSDKTTVPMSPPTTEAATRPIPPAERERVVP